MKRPLIYLVSLVLFVSGARPAHADVVVRSQETSENEFQSLAQALGHTPIADFMANEVERKLPAETAELFRQRLIEAQAEWLNQKTDAQAGPQTTPAIDQFLALAAEADWTVSERKAFAAFYVRKFQRAQDPEIGRQFAAFAAGEVFDTSELAVEERKIWEAAIGADRIGQIAFPSALPVDVTAVLVNGRALARQDFTAFKFPRVPIRLTLLSNVFQPLSLKLTGTETDWPTLGRKTWIANDCSIAQSEAVLLRSKVATLGPDHCQSARNLATASATDQQLIEKFGLERAKGEAPVPTKPELPILKKPWFWGVVGAVAVGTVVAVAMQNKNQSDGNVRPTNHDGW